MVDVEDLGLLSSFCDIVLSIVLDVKRSEYGRWLMGRRLDGNDREASGH